MRKVRVKLLRKQYQMTIGDVSWRQFKRMWKRGEI